MFVDDARFKQRAKLRSDPAKKALFDREIAQADRLADAVLQKTASDPNALFVKSLTFGLRADNAGLIEKQSFAALGYTKEGRAWAVLDAGLTVKAAEDITANVERTWAHCARIGANPILKFLVRFAGGPTRRFVKAFPLMQEAYSSGAMAFGLFVAKKPGSLLPKQRSEPTTAASN